MIAAVKGWHAAVPALLFFIPPGAPAADDLSGAARELARRTAGLLLRGETVSVAWRNASSLGSLELGQARAAFEAGLKEVGAKAGDVAPAVEAHLTLSENQTQYLLVEEIRKGEERQVWIAGWRRGETAAPAVPGAALEKKLIWEQDEQMLDVAFPGEAMLVLSPSKVALYARADGRWELKGTVPLAPVKPWERDPRGLLRVNGSGFHAYLPGAVCSGATEPGLSVECRPSDDPWVLESGSRALLLSNFAAGRNFFDGRVMTETGLRKTVGAFYSAASVDEQGRALWLLAMVDGRTQVFDAALDPAGSIAAWGSDIAGVEARCGGGSVVLAARSGDRAATDAIQAFSMVNRAAVPLSGAVDFPGPVVALWPSLGTSAVAIVRNFASGKYEAYLVGVACGG